jgi:hypothetical protein
MLKSYSELRQLKSFEERYQYLKLSGTVGKETFGFDRYLNQNLYRSEEWKHCRRLIIVRDKGCDMGCEDYEIYGRIIVHHINPITINDIILRKPKLFDPENLITVSHNTHEAITFGNDNLLMLPPIDRLPNDTCPWKKT